MNNIDQIIFNLGRRLLHNLFVNRRLSTEGFGMVFSGIPIPEPRLGFSQTLGIRDLATKSHFWPPKALRLRVSEKDNQQFALT